MCLEIILSELRKQSKSISELPESYLSTLIQSRNSEVYNMISEMQERIKKLV